MATFLSQSLFASAILLLLLTFFSSLPTTTSHLCSQAMADSLSSSGFTFFAHALRAHNLTTADARLTLLAPLDSAFSDRPVDADLLRRHVSTVGALRYRTLLTLPHNTTLPTLHGSAYLRVFSDGEAVSFNDVPVAVPNLYVDGSCAVHGIGGPVDSLFDEMPEPRNDSGDSLTLPMRRETQPSSLSKFVRRKIHVTPAHVAV